ncbi:MAG: hypothetical protein ABIT76_10550 [Chthoniobacterales bacterium]
MYFVLIIIGGFLAVFGGLTFIIDAFRVHWGWGLAVIFIPFANIVCLIKHWAETKRGFLLTLLALPFLVGAFFMMPKAGAKDASGKPEKMNDPFYNAMQRARDAAAKVKNSRNEEASIYTPAPVESTATPLATAAPTPMLTLPQRLASNRATFKKLESDFAALTAKRKALPKNDSKAIAAFNLDAKAYADKLAEARSEQAILLELERTAQK